MSDIAAFIMPIRIGNTEIEKKHLDLAVKSIENQTDNKWILIMIDDFSNDEEVYEKISEINNRLKTRIHVIYMGNHVGTGEARNVGIEYAYKIGAEFILFNDADDLSDSRRLEIARKKFQEDEDVNVVYSSFDIVDEWDNPVSQDQICMSVMDILNGHKIDIVEGENSWINIATKKNYTNLTSCTAVRTWLAQKEHFPTCSVSEDSHTWLRYGAYPGKFAYTDEIKNKYRICSGVQSRSRNDNNNFYEMKMKVEMDGFEKAVIIAKKYGCIDEKNINDIRIDFYVRLSLSMLYGNTSSCADEILRKASCASMKRTINAIENLYCDEKYKMMLKQML